MEDKDKILQLLQETIHCVVSSVNINGESNSAVVGFGSDDQMNIIFGSNSHARKVRNIKSNPRVSIVVYSRSRTVQLEGMAKEIDGNQAQEYKKLYWSKVPSAKRYDSLPDQTYFLFTPTWIRYTDISKDPEEVYEIKK